MLTSVTVLESSISATGSISPLRPASTLVAKHLAKHPSSSRLCKIFTFVANKSPFFFTDERLD